jgi:hypothetical protein
MCLMKRQAIDPRRDLITQRYPQRKERHNMRRCFSSALVVAGLVSATACSQGSKATSSSLTAPTPESAAARGNGAPNGKLVFNWNLIGTPKDYSGGCGDGHRIFVNRDVNNAHITIQDAGNGGAWSIVDCNATGGHLAVMESADLGTFHVYVRILGKIGGHLDVCAAKTITDADGDFCELDEIHLTRVGGQSKFTVQPDTLFDASNFDVFWAVDTNQDFRIAQFRVYQTQ